MRFPIGMDWNASRKASGISSRIDSGFASRLAYRTASRIAFTLVLAASAALADGPTAGARKPAAPAPAGPAGDYAPLAKGNRWVYIGDESMACKALGDQHRVRRVVRVDSIGAEGALTVYHLSYRDSLNHRLLHRWPSTSLSPADSLVNGRFRVMEAKDGTGMRIGEDGSGTVPPEFALFFHAHAYPAGWSVPGGVGTTELDEVQLRRSIPYITTDYARMGVNLGMVRLDRDYNVFNTNIYTAPERILNFRLIEFNGLPVAESARIAAGRDEDTAQADFSPVALKRSWRYSGFWRIDSASVSTCDSVSRMIQVKGRVIGGGVDAFVLTLRDSLFARTAAGVGLPDSIASDEFTVTGGIAASRSGRPTGLWRYDSDPSWSDMRRFFNGHAYPAAEVAQVSYRSGYLPVFTFVERAAGTLSDSMVYAGGVGFIKRSKTLFDGRRFREDFRLVELDGAPFTAPSEAVAIRSSKPQADGRGLREAMHTGRVLRRAVKTWNGRDAAGKSLTGARP